MRLRFILFVLSLLAVLSAFLGGFLYYTALEESAFKEAQRQADAKAKMIRENLSFYLSENIRPVRAMAGMKVLGRTLTLPDPELRRQANLLLDHFKYSLGADVCYLMNPNGLTVASSNRHSTDSFVGQNFSFRPYFQKAISGAPATYLALGATSDKRGVYYSHPVYDKPHEVPVGVAVIKAAVGRIEKELFTGPDEIVMMVSPQGVIFISSRPQWRYGLLWPVSDPITSAIARSRQFGDGPWEWVGLKQAGEGYVADREGNRYQLRMLSISNYPGWDLVHLKSLTAFSRRLSQPLLRMTGFAVLAFCLLIGLLAFFLYRRASQELIQRREAEKALRESEERYRRIYHNTPAMLHSVDRGGRVIRVSDHWLKKLGYTREAVIGRRLSDFMAPASARYLEETVMPEFFQTGFCTDIPYQFVKKNGEKMDVFLSAVGERDTHGKVIRSLAVSIDVTERKQAEAALRQAKEELSHHSRELERQVRSRTEEISSLLRYTPDVVYIKDTQGRYLLVNPCFEALFGTSKEAIRGKTDEQVLPEAVAEQFGRNDKKVLAERRSCQMEEKIPQADGVHTYLSVKFPVYDDSGFPCAVGSISTDITAAKKAQDQLRRLSASMMASQENERAALARELHDELGQILTALRMDTVWLAGRFAESDPQAARRAESMTGLIDDTIGGVRGMALRLRPGVLDDLGLVEALEWYTADFERRTEIICLFDRSRIPEISDAIATAAYRIAQEALTNVARHSFATQAEIALKAREGVLMLTVADNGRGFDTLALSEAPGLGVAGMRERAALVGGVLEIRSAPEAGTEVMFRVPINGGNKSH